MVVSPDHSTDGRLCRSGVAWLAGLIAAYTGYKSVVDRVTIIRSNESREVARDADAFSSLHRDENPGTDQQ
jgi:hypothetical protein